MTGLYLMRSVAAAICLTVSVAAIAQDRDPVTAPVHYAGLNLATASGQAAFKLRIHRAASATCQSGVSGLAGDMDRTRCIAEMQRDGDTRLATLVAAPTTQLAAVTEKPAVK